MAATELFNLHGHVALVTGGNSGIGLGMALGLAEAGADVAIWGTNEAKNTAAAAELDAVAKVAGSRVVALRCDVGEEAEVDTAFAATVDALGKVDSCFVNAGVGSGGTAFVDMSTDEWRRVMRVNSDGAFFTLRAAARHMVERGEGGSLVGTASLAVLEGQPRGQHYAASKGGLVAMIKACAVELARYGIRANALLPGWIETPMASPALNWDRFRDRVLPRVPARRWGVPSDLAGIAVYLASPASAYHTGDSFLIDGGYAIF